MLTGRQLFLDQGAGARTLALVPASLLTGRQLFLDQGAGACTLAWPQEALNAQQLPRYHILSLARLAAPEPTLCPVGPTCPVHKEGGAAP